MTAQPGYAYALQYRMPAGFPGVVSRTYAARIEAGVLSAVAGQQPGAFGLGVVIDSATGLLRLPTLTDTRIHGFLVKAYPSQGSAPANLNIDPVGSALPLGGIPQDFMVAGHMTVLLGGASSAIRGQNVYCWLGATAGVHVQGQVEASYAATYASAPKVGGNTGTGTIGNLSGGTGASPAVGPFTITFTSATAFNVTDPNGSAEAPGTVGVAYSNPRIGFTITAGGTAFVAGDGFVVTATASSLLLPNSMFEGPADTNGITEISFNN